MLEHFVTGSDTGLGMPGKIVKLRAAGAVSILASNEVELQKTLEQKNDFACQRKW